MGSFSLEFMSDASSDSLELPGPESDYDPALGANVSIIKPPGKNIGNNNVNQSVIVPPNNLLLQNLIQDGTNNQDDANSGNNNNINQGQQLNDNSLLVTKIQPPKVQFNLAGDQNDQGQANNLPIIPKAEKNRSQFYKYKAIFHPKRIIKAVSLKQFVESLTPDELEIATSCTDKKALIQYVLKLAEKMNLNLMTNIFFVAQPYFSSDETRVVVVIDQKKQVTCMRESQHFKLKGDIVSFQTKHNKKVQFGMSSRLFPKFKCQKRFKYLDKLVTQLLNDSIPDPIMTFLKCFQDNPQPLKIHGMKNIIMQTIFTPQMEFFVEMEQLKLPMEIIDIVGDVFFPVMTKTHMLFHYLRSVLPVYFDRYDQKEQFYTEHTFTTTILTIIRKVFSGDFYKVLSNKIRDVVISEEDYVEKVLEIIRDSEIPKHLLISSQYIYESAKKKFSNDPFAATSAVSTFLIVLGIKSTFKNLPRKSMKKINILLPILSLKSKITDHEGYMAAMHDIITDKMNLNCEVDKNTAIPFAKYKKSVSNLYAFFVIYSGKIREILEKTEIKEYENPLSVFIKDVYSLIEDKRAELNGEISPDLDGKENSLSDIDYNSSDNDEPSEHMKKLPDSSIDGSEAEQKQDNDSSDSEKKSSSGSDY